MKYLAAKTTVVVNGVELIVRDPYGIGHVDPISLANDRESGSRIIFPRLSLDAPWQPALRTYESYVIEGDDGKGGPVTIECERACAREIDRYQPLWGGGGWRTIELGILGEWKITAPT